MWPRIIGRNEVLISVASRCGDFSGEVLSAEHMEGQSGPHGSMEQTQETESEELGLNPDPTMD